MPNWCANDTVISSKKYKRLKKIVDRINSSNGKALYGYGNMKLFDTIYDMSHIIVNDFKLVNDMTEFNEIMTYMYKNLIDSEHMIFSNYRVLSKNTIEEIFDYVKKLIAGELVIEKEDMYKRNVDIMHSLIDTDQLKIYNLDGTGFTNLINKKEQKEIMGNKAHETYWEWTNRALGCKWDMAYVNIDEIDGAESVTGGNCTNTSEEIPYSVIQPKYSDNGNIVTGYYIRLSYETAWCPPTAFLETLSKKYKVKVKSKYYEPGMMFAGSDTYKNGKLINSMSIEDDFIECERFMDEDSDPCTLEYLLDNYRDEDDINGIWDINRLIKTSTDRDALTNGTYKLIDDEDNEFIIRGLFKKKSKEKK